MSWKRFLRAAVCLLVVCCILFNSIAVPTKALVIVDDLALGITALLILAAAGAVFLPTGNDQIASIGSSFRSSMYEWGTSAEKLDEVETWIDALTLYDPSDGDDGYDPRKTQITLARGILAGITAWIASTIMAGGVETEGEAATDGYAYYNGVLLPVLPIPDSSYAYSAIFYWSDGEYRVIYSNDSFKWRSDNVWYTTPHCSSSWYSWYSGWDPLAYYSGNGRAGFEESALLWSSHDVECFDSSWNSLGTTFMWGSEPVYAEKTVVQPSIYVGDLPAQIQNGEVDADDIVIPEVIDYGVLLQDGLTLEESVTGAMSDMVTGTLTYEEYLDQIDASADTPVFTSDLSTETVTYELDALATPLVVAASVDDGGYLSYTWYVSVDGQAETIVPGTISPKCTPATDAIGTYTYRCCVANTIDAELPSVYAWSNTATIVVSPSGTVTVPDSDAVTHTGLQGLLGNLSSVIGGLFADVVTSIQALPVAIADAIAAPIKAIFVPSEDFLTAKVEALRAEFAFVDSVMDTGQALFSAW